MTEPSLDNYRLMSSLYDFFGLVYSAGSIDECKHAFVNDIQPGQRVLFAGAGTGSDVLGAAKRGAVVSALDNSASMLQLLKRRLENSAANVNVICQDVRTFDRINEFDWVFANFFLNVFSEKEMPRILAHLATLLRPGGSLVIGDFAPAKRGLLGATQKIYFYVPVAIFCAVTKNAWHHLYDYPLYFDPSLELAETRKFGKGLFLAQSVRRRIRDSR